VQKESGMKNIPLLVGTIVGTIILIVGVAYFFSGPVAPTTESTVVDQAQLMDGATYTFGPEEAQVTVVEFSDFQCPACRASEPLVQQLKNNYGDSVKFVYRHFPLDSIHPNARLAAQASEVAGDNGKFWEYHDVLFAKQDEWADIADKQELLNVFGDYAAQLQIDKETFLEKIETQEVVARVAKDSDLGSVLQVNSTPTFFVNGQQTTAPQLISAVESAKNQSN
jgi:protein-disulfide isomerase